MGSISIGTRSTTREPETPCYLWGRQQSTLSRAKRCSGTRDGIIVNQSRGASVVRLGIHIDKSRDVCHGQRLPNIWNIQCWNAASPINHGTVLLPTSSAPTPLASPPSSHRSRVPACRAARRRNHQIFHYRPSMYASASRHTTPLSINSMIPTSSRVNRAPYGIAAVVGLWLCTAACQPSS
jgi:hypothetical protein